MIDIFIIKNQGGSLQRFFYELDMSLRMNQVHFFKGCLPQILHGPVLNTFTYIKIRNIGNP